MATPTPDPALSARGRLNALRRYRPDDDPAVVDAAQHLAVTRLEEHIRRIVATAPPLTQEQRDRVSALLRPTREDA